MGTTSPSLPKLLLRRLTAMDVMYAVLHGGIDVTSATVHSDVDIAINAPPSWLVPRLARMVANDGVRLVQVWHSDRGTVNTFWWASHESLGCQLDLLYDVRGHNRFGVKTNDVLFAHREFNGEFFQLDSAATGTYLLAKRLGKGQADELDALKQSRLGVIGTMLTRRARVLLLLPLPRSLVSAYGIFTVWTSRAFRFASRIRHAHGIAVLADLSEPEVADLVSGLCEVLPRPRVIGESEWIWRRRMSRSTPRCTFIDCRSGHTTGEGTLALLERQAFETLTFLARP